MKKLSLYVFLVLMFCNTVQALEEPINGNPPKEKILPESSLPKCKGTDYDNWTNCQGTREEKGLKYVGEFKDGKRHGKGKAFPIEPEQGNKWSFLIVNGIWENNFIIKEYPFLLPECKGTDSSQWTNCQGTKIYDSGNKYIGQWSFGEYEYYGTFIWTDGASYVGQYIAGQKDGEGTFTYPSGEIEKGIWELGELVERTE